MSILSILGENKFWNTEDSGCGPAHHNVRVGTHARRGTHGIMAHSGFGAMSLVIDGKKYMLPAAALKKDGTVKKAWASIVAARDTQALLAKGATIAVA